MAPNGRPTCVGIGGPLQIGTLASLRSEWVAHFVGIRTGDVMRHALA
jgi:hypothetical protein